MSEFLKIDGLCLPKLNNAEYTNFMNRTLFEIKEASIEKLGITAEKMAELESNTAKMQNLVAQSRISNKTATLEELDKKRDNIIVYLLSEIDNKRRSPIANIKDAAITLYNAVHVYRGIQNLPVQQETQQINGLIEDLERAENDSIINMLNLDEVVDELRIINIDYETLTAIRTFDAAVSAQIENSKTVRAANDPVYEHIMTMAFVTSVSTPSTNATTFIERHNALIKETTMLYNLRKGSLKQKPDTDPKPTPESETTPTHGQEPEPTSNP